MRTFGAVSDRPLPVFLNGVVGESLAIGMLAVPNRLGDSITETDHVVLPVPNVIPKLLPENDVPFVVSIKVKVECVNQARSVVIDDNGGAHGAVRLATPVRRHTFEP